RLLDPAPDRRLCELAIPAVHAAVGRAWRADRPRAAAARQHRRRGGAECARRRRIGPRLLRNLRDLDAVQSARLGLRAAFPLLDDRLSASVRGAARANAAQLVSWRIGELANHSPIHQFTNSPIPTFTSWGSREQNLIRVLVEL